jgi:enterochelin esterase family protein
VGVVLAGTLLAAALVAGGAPAQEKQQEKQKEKGKFGKGGFKGPQVISPEVKSDHTVVFRVNAPKAETVNLQSSDLPQEFQPRKFSKNDAGVWELTINKVAPGTYRYVITVDGLRLVDPVNPKISESNNTAWSVVHVPGSDFMDTANVPHGAVAAVYYPSSVLGQTRRLHVYTPPGYETSGEKYPVFYLLHGAGDSDDSWTSVGRANFILDNLIAAKKIEPMVVVMPAGHQPAVPGAKGGKGGGASGGRFEEEFQKDIMPYVEKHYRVLDDRNHRAIAGLSMGGAQTLAIALAQPKDFAYVGVFSSGFLGKGGVNEGTIQKIKQSIGSPEIAKGLKLLWFATGKDDFLIKNTRGTVDAFQSNGTRPVFVETTGGHTWINWQLYLRDFAPQLFRD